MSNIQSMSIEQKIEGLKKGIAACKKRGDNYDLLQKGLDKLLSEVNRLQGSTQITAPAAAKPNATSDNISEINPIGVIGDIDDISNSDIRMKDFYYFNSIEAGRSFRIWKGRLRAKLLNYALTENPRKKENKRIDTVFYVQGCLTSINHLIENHAREEFKDSLPNRRYSMGSKKLSDTMGVKEVIFGFDYDELKKTFKF